MGKKRGAMICNCKPLLGQPQASPGTLICSACGYVAKLSPSLTTIEISKREMESTFKTVWGPEERIQYKYFLELMKPLAKDGLQPARTAYLKVEEMRKNGTIDRTRALAQAAAGA